MVTVALLTLVTAVSAWRAAGLITHPTRPSAEREERFMAWAWREPEVARLFAALEEELPAGRPVLLVVDPKQSYNAQWWRFMASYHLADNPVLDVRVGPPREQPPGDWAVIYFPAGGEPEVRGRGVLP